MNLSRKSKSCIFYLTTNRNVPATIEDFLNQPGSYSLLIDTSELRPSDDISLTINLRPHFSVPPVTFISTRLESRLDPQNPAPLFHITIPYSDGFSITLTQDAGAQRQLKLYLTQITMKVRLPHAYSFFSIADPPVTAPGNKR